MHELQRLAIFCDIDDFRKRFAPIYPRRLLQARQRRRLELCACKSEGNVLSIEEVRQMLSKVKGSIADVIIAEREERF